MASMEDQIREIRSAIAQVQSKKARAAVDLENAESRLAQAKATLKEEFGVETTSEAKAALASLQEELRVAIEDIEATLEASGA